MSMHWRNCHPRKLSEGSDYKSEVCGFGCDLHKANRGGGREAAVASSEPSRSTLGIGTYQVDININGIAVGQERGVCPHIAERRLWQISGLLGRPSQHARTDRAGARDRNRRAPPIASDDSSEGPMLFLPSSARRSKARLSSAGGRRQLSPESPP